MHACVCVCMRKSYGWKHNELGLSCMCTYVPLTNKYIIIIIEINNYRDMYVGLLVNLKERRYHNNLIVIHSTPHCMYLY